MNWEPYDSRKSNYDPSLEAIKGVARVLVSPYGFSNLFEDLSREVGWSLLAQTGVTAGGAILDLSKYVAVALGGICVIDGFL